MDPWLDVLDHPPIESGWYATVTCWDVEEGLFPGAHYWDGKGWLDGRAVTSRSPQTFATEALADVWAHEHDQEKPWPPAQ